MLRSRIIPCLLIHKRGLVKTVRFKDPKYVGDPLNAVRIFNEKEVDELVVLDIDASITGEQPEYHRIADLAAECRMPLCYGGGIKTVAQAKKILSLGVEKIALSSVVLENPNLVREIAAQVGAQSVVVVLDVRKKKFSNRYEVYSKNGKNNSKRCVFDLIKELAPLGVGEFLVNSIDNDGVMKGYDENLVDQLYSKVDVPLTILGGAGTHSDLRRVISKYRLIGVAAGSLFVFKGVFKAVLINYPDEVAKRALTK